MERRTGSTRKWRRQRPRSSRPSTANECPEGDLEHNHRLRRRLSFEYPFLRIHYSTWFASSHTPSLLETVGTVLTQSVAAPPPVLAERSTGNETPRSPSAGHLN